MTERRRLWEIGCSGMDAVLCTSFDADELTLIDGRFKAAYDIPDHPGVRVPYESIVYAMAHRACHSDNSTSRKIESRLNGMHSRVIEAFARADRVDVLSGCYTAAENPDDLGGCMWAVLTDPREDLKRHGLLWIQGLMNRAMLYWMGSAQACPDEREGA